MSDEEIRVEEEESAGESEKKAEETEWVEELKVAGEELVDTVMGLIKEASVRRIVVKSSEGRVLLEIPLVIGLAGIALIPYYAALALIAALATDSSILVERVEKTTESAEQ